MVAIADRAFRIETSDNAATVITDVEAKDILENAREFFDRKTTVEEFPISSTPLGIDFMVQALVKIS